MKKLYLAKKCSRCFVRQDHTSYLLMDLLTSDKAIRWAVERTTRRRRADVKVGRESSNQFEYNTNGFNRNHRRFVRVRGCPKARGANKRDEAATRREREIKEKPSTQLAEKSRHGKKRKKNVERKQRKKAKNKRDKGEGWTRWRKDREFVCRLMWSHTMQLHADRIRNCVVSPGCPPIAG